MKKSKKKGKNKLSVISNCYYKSWISVKDKYSVGVNMRCCTRIKAEYECVFQSIYCDVQFYNISYDMFYLKKNELTNKYICEKINE